MNKILNIIIVLISIYTLHTAIETYFVNKKIDNFKKEATYQYSLDDNDFYKVDSNINNESGDILLSRKSGNPNLLLKDIISFYVGGHAALVIDQEKTLEVFGNLDKDNFVKIYENDWLETEIEVIGMKVEGNYELEYSSYLDQLYNWFPFYNNANKKYCTELISNIYSDVGVNINYDLGVITVNDIILSKNTSIYLYKEISDNKVNIYYMG